MQNVMITGKYLRQGNDRKISSSPADHLYKIEMVHKKINVLTLPMLGLLLSKAQGQVSHCV